MAPEDELEVLKLLSALNEEFFRDAVGKDEYDYDDAGDRAISDVIEAIDGRALNAIEEVLPLHSFIEDKIGRMKMEQLLEALKGGGESLAWDILRLNLPNVKG